MATERTMSTTWRGTLMEGSGTIHEAGSGAFGPLDVTWASRAEEPDGKTSPEELIAAAHSACFSMALSHALAQAGTPADQLDTSATVTFVPGHRDHEDRALRSRQRAGLDEAAFVAAAEGAKVGLPGLEGARRACPRSRSTRRSRLQRVETQPRSVARVAIVVRAKPRHQLELGLVDVRATSTSTVSQSDGQAELARDRLPAGRGELDEVAVAPSCRSRGCARRRRARARRPGPRSRACSTQGM